ncbi:MAG: carbohydrate binding domain-containing protein, partial [Clostridiales Family XIII bacterium]|nr:carbohydrate binding domain-containing protein [Clostridiales Family XIII bacterium]
LSGAFSIRRQALADSGYYDLIVTDGASGETVTIPRVQGLSSVAFYAQEAYDASTPRTDLYLDSFLLKPAAQSVVRPTGHTGAYNTENDPDNLIRNASIETNRFGKLFDAAIWYPNNAALFQDTTYSHSGRASLRIADRNVFWHRAEYRVEGLEIEPDRTYNISGYASSLEETTVDLLLEIGAYGGPENDPYPHQLIYLSDGDTRPGTWTKLSGSFQITETPTADRDYFDYTITHSASGERLTIPHVKGISMANVMVQEKYSAAEKRTDLYLDSFLFKGAPKNPARPAGHAGAGNPQNDPGNLIRNGSFETDSFSQKLQTGLWWPAVPGVNLTRLSDYSHSGSHSLMVSGRGEHWHMAMYRVGAEDLSVGHEYELSGYFSSLEKTRANLEITFWNALPGSNGQWASDTMILDHGSIAPGTWTKLGATFKLTKEGDSYVIACNGQSIRIPARYGIGCIEILPLLTPGTFNRKTDMYLDSFLMKDTTPKPSFPQLKGHANEPDTEDIDGTLSNNAGVEADLLWNDINFGLWFTNGAGYDVRFVDGFSHSGKQSVQIYNRKNGANTLLYRVEAGSIQYGAEYELSGWVAAAAKAKAKLMLQVYGYDGRGGYPAQTVPLSSAGVGQTFSNLKGTFAILYEDGVLYLNTAGGKTKIGACKGLSGIEFWVETEEEGLWPPDLYLDSFSLLIGRTAGNLSIAGAGADPEINSVMQGDSVEAILTGFSTPGSAGAGADGIVLIVSCAVILASAALIAIRLLKRRKAAQSAGEAG